MGKGEKRLLIAERGKYVNIDAVENPLDFIAEVHMREREICALIDKTVSAASMNKADIREILAFLEEQLPQHLADEQIDLFPLMLERCDPEDEIENVIGKLQNDHGHAKSDAPEIIAILRQWAEKPARPSEKQAGQMTAFAHHARRHLILENAVVLPIARLRLTKTDLKNMKRHMLERRQSGAEVEKDR